MALALNSLHPLFGNILAFVCPNEANNEIVDLKVPARTLTTTSGAYTFGSGIYGRFLQAPAVNNSALLCSPVIYTGNRRVATYTVLVVCNNTNSLFAGGANQPTYFKYAETMGINKATGNLTINDSISAIAAESDAAVLNNGSYTAALTYSGTEVDNLRQLYHDGVFKVSAAPSSTSGTITMDELHDSGSFTNHATSYNYIVVFDRVLTATEIADLHASLGADNQFALVASGATSYTITAEAVTDAHASGDVTLTYVGVVTAYSITADTVTESHTANDVALNYSALAAITSEPLYDNTNGTTGLLANTALDYVAIYDNVTGALVLRVTGLSTNASGIFTVSNAALTPGVTYKLDWQVTTTGVARMPVKAAV